MGKIDLLKRVLILHLICSSFGMTGQSTWTANSTPSPYRSGGLMLLLSDGSVLCKGSEGGSDGFGNLWFKLKPDPSGNYQNGTWSIAASMRDTRLYFSSQVMKNGKVYVAGGEYGTGIGTAEMYDPLTNSWNILPAGTSHHFSDANSEILDDGRILQADLAGSAKQTFLYNPQTNSYSSGPTCLGIHNESTWIKLPDNSILFVDLFSTSSERYIPSLNQWVADATVPAVLYDPYAFETGPAMLLPNGKAIFFGSTGNTAIYTPSGNSSPGTWVAGPNLPTGKGCPDTQCAIAVDGKILLTAGNSPTANVTAFDPPTYFYEFDYLTNTFSSIQAPGGGTQAADSAFNFNMLNLPDGTIMLSQVNTTNFYFHKPAGSPLASGVPTISSITQSGCSNSFTATGLLFNGLSEGAVYGDDWQMNTNYPLIRLQSGNNVYYARTYNWNHTGVQNASQLDTTEFSLPPNLPNGTYSLYIVVNGIPSAPHSFTFNAFPTLTSPLTATPVCSGNTFTYNATTNMSGTTLQWTRPSVVGISNPAVTTAQSANPSETFTNTSGSPKTVVYSYTLSNGGCQTYYSVNCVVSPGPAISTNGNTLACPGSTLVALGANSFTWNGSILSNSLVLSTPGSTVFSISANDPYGCTATEQITVTVKPVPVFSISGNTLICEGETTLLSVTGNPTTFYWDNGITTPTIEVSPMVNNTYTVYCNIPGGCQTSESIEVTVNNCAGLTAYNRNQSVLVYPNPFSGTLCIDLKNTGDTDVTVTCCDVSGRIIQTQELKTTGNTSLHELEFQNLDKGLYVLTLQSATGKMIYRIVKE